MDLSGYLHSLVPSPQKRAYGIIEQKAGWAPSAACKIWKGEVLSTAGSRIRLTKLISSNSLLFQKVKNQTKLLERVSCIMSLSMELVTETLTHREPAAVGNLKDRSYPVVQRT